MFEKEAEEYGKTSTDSYKDCLVDIDDISVLDEAITEGFKDGAEYGYKYKENEWHYDEPTESKNNFYVILKNGNHRICYWDLTSKAYKWLKNVVNGEHITFNLIRCWKEIVLPKESE